MREKVFVARVRSYDDPDAIADAVRRGLDFLGWKPPARLVGKANWVLAHQDVARSCYTRPEFLKGALKAILSRNEQSKIELIGNSGAGVPTRTVVRRATGMSAEFQDRGAFELERIFPGRVKISPSDGGKLLRYRLSVGAALSADERAWIDKVHVESSSIDLTRRYWREVQTSAALHEADAFILFPKIKSNVLSHGLTGAIKLQGIGLLLDDARMDGHNYHNHRRMVDLLEVAEPDLIVSDGIEMALGGNQMTERGHLLGVIVMATNAVAHDSTVARILNLRAEEIEHLKIASERAYGPLWANEIEVGGDVRVGELNSRVRGFGDTGFIPVNEFAAKFERETRLKLPLQILAEAPWDVAGAHGLVLDWLYMTYDTRERRKLMAQWPAATILVGNFHEKTPEPGNDVVFVVGDRAIEAWRRLGWGGWGLSVPRLLQSWLHGPIRVERFTRPDGRKGRAWLIAGDPPTHRDVIISIALATRFAVRPPLLRLDLILDSYLRMIGTTLRRFFRNLLGVKCVDAASIERLKARKTERAKLLEMRRFAEADTHIEQPSWVPPAASPSAKMRAVEPLSNDRSNLPHALEPTTRIARQAALPAPTPVPAPVPAPTSTTPTQREIASPETPTQREIAAPQPSRPEILTVSPSGKSRAVTPGEATTRADALAIAAAETTVRIEPLGCVPPQKKLEILVEATRGPSAPQPPPAEPALVEMAGATTSRMDIAEEAAASPSASILSPEGAAKASPFSTTLKLDKADVDAAVAATTAGGNGGRQAAPAPPAAAAPSAPPGDDTLRGAQTQEMSRPLDGLEELAEGSSSGSISGSVSGVLDRTAELDEEDDEEPTESIPCLDADLLAAALPKAEAPALPPPTPSSQTQPMNASEIAVAVNGTRPRGKKPRGKATKAAKGAKSRKRK